MTPELVRNLRAGTTTAVLLIPQSMAYALVAGVEPINGLYASLLPLIVYAFIGRSRELALGPGALDTLLIGTAVAAFATDDNAATVVAILALQVALIQITLGFLKGGFLVNFLSKPVVSGFTSAAALTIALSQTKHLLGIEISNGDTFVSDLMVTIQNLSLWHPTTALFGIVSMVFIYVCRHIRRSFPNALAVVALATLASFLLEIEPGELKILGSIPSGLPAIGFTMPTAGLFIQLLPSAVTIAAVGYLASISIARTFADRNKYQISANRELIALGAANFAASVSQAFPVSGSFSRSAVHAEGGSTSPYSLIVTAFWILLTLLFLTDLLYYLPEATLSAIIITAVLGLVDTKLVKELKTTKPSDMWLLITTFVATLSIGVIEGIMIGVISSLALFIFETTRPHTALLGRVPNTDDFRNVLNYPDVITYDGIIMVRIDAQFYFGNVTFLKGLLRDLEHKASMPTHTIIIEACSISQLDSSADAALHDIANDLASRNIQLKFASVKIPVLKVMKASGLYALLGEANFFMNLKDALTASLPPENKRIN